MPHHDPPGPGDAFPVPGAVVPDQHGERLPLRELWAQGPALLVLVPAAFSTHCTAELGALAFEIERFDAAGVQLAALSCDPVTSLRAWGEDRVYPFPLLSDFWPHGAVSRALGAFDEDLGVAQRLSLLVVDGTVRWSLRGDLGAPRSLKRHLAALDEV
ncbi:peroxiredoxin [Kineococcus radiotolerans]|uniref:Alkyl hydroperoxide reductase/ Thiol specific antioxidant/ Mal allergen n=2 Tax=Kineococcus radiotolerans TaxID=131568 RepID=A6WDB2_KINRD|nr:peroxiredoxin [Kineococcus radiotolerans]ABS04801.1 alkyl hydroperoxide reductase/ Thiol specific antioxidant/ Mal allergen [Kineococcus radiotolerans SRS30216 = ATCC BAA-149]MBB2901644.1 peroxiredoxin [Kineococcus radiotolerans]